MRLKQLTLYNFKCFLGKHTFSFEKLNVILGANGKGKSTVIKDSLLFCLHGWADKPLSELPTRGKSKSCKVVGVFDDCTISREYPTKLTISGLDFANSQEAQKWINDKFKGVDFFRKFRMIDIKQGINILEEGKTSFRKTLFSFNDSIFNNVRKNLQGQKREREIWNIDNVESHTHYPSEKRLEKLKEKKLKIREQIFYFEKEISKLNQSYISRTEKKAGYNATREIYKNQKDRIVQYSNCPTCKRKVTEKTKLKLLKGINETIKKCNESVINILPTLEQEQENINCFKINKQILQSNIDKINVYISKLENRLKQKKYIWNTEDVLLVKKAIEELDGFSDYYITEWVKVLEPIINNIIEKIGFQLKFELDIRGNLEIQLFRGGEQYSYKDLSSGQRLMLAIAFQLALLLEQNEEGLIIADDGINCLDEENLSYVIDFFKDLPFQLTFTVQRWENIPDGVKVIKL